MTIAPPCSAALPTIATITAAMKNSDAPTADAKPWIDFTSSSLTIAVAPVVAASTPSATGSGHASADGASRARRRWRWRLRPVTAR